MNQESNWPLIETNKHQDHVIAHVMGATVLGWVVAGEAAHLLLDIGFLWTVYLDAEMNLLPQNVALTEIEADELTSVDKTELVFDADLLLSEGREAVGLKRFTAAPVECLVNSVEVFGANARRRVIVRGEQAQIQIETSLENSQIRLSAQATD
jgi:hypothetical protein